MTLELPSNSSGLRFSLALVMALTVVSSPILIFANPTQALAATTNSNSNRIDTSNYHSDPQAMQASVPSTSSTPPESNYGNDFTAQAPLSPPGSFLSTDIVGSKAIYEIVFVTVTTGTIKKIEITFPTGTDISGANIIERVGIGSGTLVKSGTTLTLDIQNAVSIPAGTYIRLEIVNIKNPQSPSSNYKVTVTTRNPANDIIDGATQSTAYIVKQISATNIDPRFMRSRFLKDDPTGGSFGWKPDGMTTNFIIIDEAAVLSANAVLINVGDSASNSQCEALGSLSGFFTIQCATPPPEGSELRYTTLHLPLTF